MAQAQGMDATEGRTKSAKEALGDDPMQSASGIGLDGKRPQEDGGLFR
uniref:Uncharacterized protein n=1 Tax=Tetranychus urticae TaxID=32264 RepID=T1KCX4_TETUR